MIWNIPNILTLLRIPLLLLIVMLDQLQVSYAYEWITAVFLLAMVSDYLDGVFARRWDQITDFGKVADPLLDKIFVLGIMFWMLVAGIIPQWNLAIVLLLMMREFAVTGLRGGAGGFGAAWHGKWKTALLFIALLLFLIVAILESRQTFESGVIDGLKWFALVLFWLGSLLGIYSGILYFGKKE